MISPLAFREVILGVVISIQSFVPAAVLRAKTRAGAGGHISHLHFSGPYERRGSDHQLGSAGGPKPTALLCVYSTCFISPPVALRRIVPAEAVMKL